MIFLAVDYGAFWNYKGHLLYTLQLCSFSELGNLEVIIHDNDFEELILRFRLAKS